MDQQTDIAEFSPEVIDAEAELIIPELPAVPEVKAETNEVSEAAAHAVAIIEPTPDLSPVVPEAVEVPQAPIEVAQEPVLGDTEQLPRDTTLTSALEEAREEAIDEERAEAIETDARTYGELRDKELDIQVQAEHEQWSPDQRDSALDELKSEASS